MTPLQLRVSGWLFESALPFWAEGGPDKKFGGFIEELAFDGTDAASPYKRTRVASRQMYVFSHAATLGWTDGVDLIGRGGEWLVDRAWLGDGFARRLTRQGDILDPTPDLYDHAFALFGFAWAYRATRDALWAEWAARTHDVILSRFAAAGGGAGFAHEIPMTGWRLQNPHMHLLEASLAAHAATGDARYEETARHVIDLFLTKFLQPSGTLCEYFDRDWAPAPGDDGRLREPGHQFEWVWILNECAKAFGVELDASAVSLARTAEQAGVDPAGRAVRDAVFEDGRVIKGGSRTWPNTERVKASVALAEIRARGTELPEELDPAAMNAESIELLLDRYLSQAGGVPVPGGGWIDAFDAEGRPVVRTMPASTFYHVFLAFAEALRAPSADALGGRAGLS